MGRHVISVTIMGNADDLDASLRKAQRSIAGLSKGLNGLGRQNSDLTRQLKASERAIKRWGAQIVRTGGEIDGIQFDVANLMLDDLRRRKKIRIIKHQVDKAARKLRLLLVGLVLPLLLWVVSIWLLLVLRFVGWYWSGYCWCWWYWYRWFIW